jgi:hypothetical protein
MTVSRRLVAVFAADVEGYSRLMGADEVGTLGNPLAATLSRRWDVRTDAPSREHVPVGKVFAADSRPYR